jgi:hypothetical protein
VLSLRKL